MKPPKCQLLVVQKAMRHGVRETWCGSKGARGREEPHRGGACMSSQGWGETERNQKTETQSTHLLGCGAPQ